MDLLDKDSSPYSKLRTKKNKFLGAIIGGAAAIGGSLLGKKISKRCKFSQCSGSSSK